jgi:hypothetical protein
MTRAKYWDCVECADQHKIEDMYSQEGSWICEECFHETFFLEKEDAK